MKRNLFLGLLAAGALLVSCEDPGPVGVDSLTMRGSLTLEVGESSSLWATIQPPAAAGRQILYFVEDPSVATYDEITQEVTAVGTGRTKIGASAGGKTAVCEVSVVEAGSVVDILDRIPDENLRSYLRSQSGSWDNNRDGVLSAREAATRITYLNVKSRGIHSLEGIEHFTSLMTLDCSDNPLTDFDATRVPNLQLLHCTDTPLTTLDMSGCLGLRLIDVERTPLVSLDLSGCVGLTQLTIVDSPLSELDVSGCTALVYLYCSGNELTKLDVSGCSSLFYLDCPRNRLTELDLSNLAKLGDVRCDGNRLSSLELSGCPVLYFVMCSGNALRGIDISDTRALCRLFCSNNPGVAGVFTVRSWFAGDEIPTGPAPVPDYLPGEYSFPTEWEYEGQTVIVDYQKAI